jgi:hypothetical protein
MATKHNWRLFRTSISNGSGNSSYRSFEHLGRVIVGGVMLGLLTLAIDFMNLGYHRLWRAPMHISPGHPRMVKDLVAKKIPKSAFPT